MSVASGLLRTARPKQWIKNVLVLAAPAAALQLDHADVLVRTLVVFVVFCFAASSVYLLNDAMDVEADRAHPTKRFRPIAAGEVPVKVAYAVAAASALVALVGASLLNLRTLALIAFYLVLNVAYCLRFKHVVLVDVVIVASGFVIRAAAGGIASGLELSQWFLLTATFGALFIAVGKRASDIVLIGSDEVAKTRRALEDYPREYLRFLLVFAAAGCAISYGLWAFSILEHTPHFPWAFFSMVFFVFILLRYALLVELGRGGEPEVVVMHDRTVQVAGLLFVIAFAGALLQW